MNSSSRSGHTHRRNIGTLTDEHRQQKDDTAQLLDALLYNRLERHTPASTEPVRDTDGPHGPIRG